ncbi:glucosaminidase domain-containing protein [Candidatus Gottesmanbacteria bacterium]|nr:glucosaminidase domain-containing protein [Candidatus Gottesmanbacteria bacterium]
MRNYIVFTILFSLIVLAFPQKTYSDSAQINLKVDYVDLEKARRIRVLENFLNKYNSPLAAYTSVFVDEAYSNNLDWRLVASIAGVESTFGKTIPANSYNGWGWNNGKYSFESWEDAISTISESLNVKYAQKWGAKDPYQIGKYYAASPTWASRVTYFMEKIEKSSPETEKLTFNL